MLSEMRSSSARNQIWIFTIVIVFLSVRCSGFVAIKSSVLGGKARLCFGPASALQQLHPTSKLLPFTNPDRPYAHSTTSAQVGKRSWWKKCLQKAKDCILPAKSPATSRPTRSRYNPYKATVLRLITAMVTMLTMVVGRSQASWASGVLLDAPTSAGSTASAVKGMVVWAALFIFTAIMHSAESAITKISPWKIQEFAEEEGPKSPFATLTTNLTNLLTTILLLTTTCSIYSTALYVASMSTLFPRLSLGFLSFSLTVLTLFFGELVPKAVAVNNSEFVARHLVPWIHRIASVLMPFVKLITALSDFVLIRVLGVKSQAETDVSEDMLRMVVDEAQRSENIDTAEGRMIKNVLNMQDREVERIMQPRVDMISLPETASAMEILQVAVYTKYSRIPIYRGDIDNIVGIVFSKDLLDYLDLPAELKGFGGNSKSTASRLDASFLNKMDRSTGRSRGGSKRTTRKNAKPAKIGTSTTQSRLDKSNNDNADDYEDDRTITTTTQRVFPVGANSNLPDRWHQVNAREMMETAYFIPETMSCWDALQEMKKRRLHMAIVVDEYGGTAGLVTLEDILEEVVGEIYDEDDDKEEQRDDWTIFRHNQHTFSIKAYAEVSDVFEALKIDKEEVMPQADEYSTIGGLLCSIAGKIPQEGDIIPFAGYSFYISKVENRRRIVDIIVEPIVRTDLLEEVIQNGEYAYSSSGNSDGNLSTSSSSAAGNASSGKTLTSVVKAAYDEMIAKSQSTYDHQKQEQHSADSNSDESDRDVDNQRTDSFPYPASPNNQNAAGVGATSTSGTNTQLPKNVMFDSQQNKFLIFQDGEWIDPDSL